ncbi:MAG: hypothetical protein V7646_7145, partial [Pseudonocardia sp.]
MTGMTGMGMTRLRRMSAVVREVFGPRWRTGPPAVPGPRHELGRREQEREHHEPGGAE